MIVHREYKQGDAEWLLARAGIPTASEFDSLVSPTGEIRKGQMPATFLAAKLAEAWQGGPLPSFGSFAIEQGQILESEALPWVELEFGLTIERVGFITTDDKKCGCSPDGLLAAKGVEVKCPEATQQIKYVLGGVVPPDYMAQVQGGMFVTGLDQWMFVSYRRSFPKLVLTVERDDAFQCALKEALAQFHMKFELAMMRLEEINGGPRPTLTAYTPRAAREPAEAFQSAMPS